MLQTKKIIGNYKYSRESSGNDTFENQTPSLVTEDQFNTVKNFIDLNQVAVDKILAIDESTLSEERLSRVKAIKMVMENNGSYEKYLNNNVGNQESANEVYKTEQRNTSEAVGLANYEEDHDSAQKTALIERVKTLRGLKSNTDAAFSSIQQLQLEVAERLLGPQTVAAEFPVIHDSIELEIKNNTNKPNEYSEYDKRKQVKIREERREKKLDQIKYGIKSPSKSNLAGEGFVMNAEKTLEQAEADYEKGKNALRETYKPTEYVSHNHRGENFYRTKSNVEFYDKQLIRLEEGLLTSQKLVASLDEELKITKGGILGRENDAQREVKHKIKLAKEDLQKNIGYLEVGKNRVLEANDKFNFEDRVSDIELEIRTDLAERGVKNPDIDELNLSIKKLSNGNSEFIQALQDRLSPEVNMYDSNSRKDVKVRRYSSMYTEDQISNSVKVIKAFESARGKN
jgi:hypothetical protein